LLACLYDELGRVVPYERLCPVIGHRRCGERQMHALQQQMMLVRRLLTKHETRYFLAVVAGVGYALCEMAEG
jgi:DNA-binding response OmpR family regulator